MEYLKEFDWPSHFSAYKSTKTKAFESRKARMSAQCFVYAAVAVDAR